VCDWIKSRKKHRKVGKMEERDSKRNVSSTLSPSYVRKLEAPEKLSREEPRKGKKTKSSSEKKLGSQLRGVNLVGSSERGGQKKPRPSEPKLHTRNVTRDYREENEVRKRLSHRNAGEAGRRDDKQ